MHTKRLHYSRPAHPALLFWYPSPTTKLAFTTLGTQNTYVQLRKGPPLWFRNTRRHLPSTFPCPIATKRQVRQWRARAVGCPGTRDLFGRTALIRHITANAPSLRERPACVRVPVTDIEEAKHTQATAVAHANRLAHVIISLLRAQTTSASTDTIIEPSRTTRPLVVRFAADDETPPDTADINHPALVLQGTVAAKTHFPLPAFATY